jgi:lipopolysaccharide transport protein LptA
MADSNHNRAWVLCAVLACATAGAAPYDATAPINLEAASSDFDYRNNTLLFRRVKVSQGGLQVEAMEARATGLNFENSKWDLEGQVRVTVPDGKLLSDSATVTFRNNEIVSATVRGSPATFEQRLEKTGELARGRARTIEYDVRNQTVRLAGDAWLTDGPNQIQGNTLVYDIGRQRVAANPGETEPGGVRITINPKESTQQRKPKPDQPKPDQPRTEPPKTEPPPERAP